MVSEHTIESWAYGTTVFHFLSLSRFCAAYLMHYVSLIPTGNNSYLDETQLSSDTQQTKITPAQPGHCCSLIDDTAGTRACCVGSDRIRSPVGHACLARLRYSPGGQSHDTRHCTFDAARVRLFGYNCHLRWRLSRCPRHPQLQPAQRFARVAHPSLQLAVS